ncbi:MAG: hypothetical protein H0V42_02200 [Nocardioidaceae bacterium]|nr:hypothetical protein [Nocardioidaceae bacterium]
MRNQLLAWAALGLHCTVVLFLYLSLGLSVPAYAYVGFLLLWAAFLILAVLLLRRRSKWLIAVPAVAVVVWVVLALLGDVLLGWTA